MTIHVMSPAYILIFFVIERTWLLTYGTETNYCIGLFHTKEWFNHCVSMPIISVTLSTYKPCFEHSLTKIENQQDIDHNYSHTHTHTYTHIYIYIYIYIYINIKFASINVIFP